MESTDPSKNWDDDIGNQFLPAIAVRRICMAMSSIILSLQVTYEWENGTLYETPGYGDIGSTHNLVIIDLVPDECIVQVTGLVTDSGVPVVISFTIIDRSAGNTITYGPFRSDSGESGTPFSVEGVILGFFGTHMITGNSIQGIGFYYQMSDLPPWTATMGPNYQGQFEGGMHECWILLI